MIEALQLLLGTTGGNFVFVMVILICLALVYVFTKFTELQKKTTEDGNAREEELKTDITKERLEHAKKEEKWQEIITGFSKSMDENTKVLREVKEVITELKYKK